MICRTRLVSASSHTAFAGTSVRMRESPAPYRNDESSTAPRVPDCLLRLIEASAGVWLMLGTPAHEVQPEQLARSPFGFLLHIGIENVPRFQLAHLSDFVEKFLIARHFFAWQDTLLEKGEMAQKFLHFGVGGERDDRLPLAGIQEAHSDLLQLLVHTRQIIAKNYDRDQVGGNTKDLRASLVAFPHGSELSFDVSRVLTTVRMQEGAPATTLPWLSSLLGWQHGRQPQVHVVALHTPQGRLAPVDCHAHSVADLLRLMERFRFSRAITGPATVPLRRPPSEFASDRMRRPSRRRPPWHDPTE